MAMFASGFNSRPLERTIRIDRYVYNQTMRRVNGKAWYGVYMCWKIWHRDADKAVHWYIKLKRSNKFDKVKLHKNCVYATRKVATRFPGD